MFKSSGRMHADLLAEIKDDLNTDPRNLKTRKSNQKKTESDKLGLLGFGFLTPLRTGDELFKMTKSLKSQVTDNIKNLIKTTPGERLINCGLGVGLSNSFDLSDELGQDEIMQKIRDQVARWMPFVKLNTVEFLNADPVDKDFLNKQTNSFDMIINYDIPLAGVASEDVNITVSF